MKSGVEAETRAVVAVLHHLVAPPLIVEIPLDGCTQTRLEIEDGLPVQFGGDTVSIDRVAQVVPRTIGDELDERGRS